MSGKKRNLSADEQLLWRRVAATVKPRRAAKEAELAPRSGEPAAPTRPKSPPAAPVKQKAKTPPPLADRGGEKKVRRGQVAIEARLDLHGYTQDAALAALSAFLARAHGRGVRTVLVITGAGRGGEGVLKRRLPDWLERRDLRPLVAAFAPAHRTHGGAGALYVFLKRK